METTGRIRNFKEKPALDACFSNLANTGLYIVEPEAMRHVPDGKAFDFAKDLFPRLVARKEVYGCVVDGFWTDVGNLKGYMEASRWILERKGSECADTADIKDSEIQGDVVIGEYAKVKESVIRGPAVIGNHATVLKSEMYNSVIFPGANVAETVLRNSVIGENAVIRNEEITNCIR
jgi:NDP-sugar pyrophosphorylase family protein